MANQITESWSTAGAYTFTIPSFAQNISFVLRGGRGGNTGASFQLGSTLTCGGFTHGGRGQYITGTLDDTIMKGQDIAIRIGDNGTDNSTSFGFDSGSGGGAGYHSGGSGGYAPGGGETWCTAGGGAGGGGSSAISFQNGTLILEAGGGGGAGGAGFGFGGFEVQNNPGYNTFLTTSLNGNNGTNGGIGTNSANSGSGGGGGGNPRGSGGANNPSGNHIPGYPGQGGGGYYNSSYVTSASVKPESEITDRPSDGYFSITYDEALPPVVSLTSTADSIIRGQCVTLTWLATGDSITSTFLTEYDNPGTSGSDEFCPLNTTVYVYTATNVGGTSNATKTITVYIPPVLNLTSTKEDLVIGECATLNWFVSGDGDTIYWTSGGVNNGNVNSSQVVCPTDTTTYSAYVTGLGGTSPIAEVIIVVYQIPVIDNFEIPTTLNYGEQGQISADYTYGNVSAIIEVQYRYVDINGNEAYVQKPSIILSASSSAELNGVNKSVTNLVDTNIEYDDFGPRSITYTLIVTGSGGSVSQSKVTSIVIDELPDNIDLVSSEDLIKDQEPIYTPNSAPDEIVLSDLYQVNNIDIPVEIKSDYPVLVDINNNNDWKTIREL